MKFTFGIITNGSVPHLVNTIIDTIEGDVPEDSYEVIVVGGKYDANEHRKNTYTVEFDETQKPLPWVTRKKNIITQMARYENVVYMYDYVSVMSGFYKGFLEWNDDDWDLCMTRITNNDGKRFRDWVSWDSPIYAKVSHNGTGQYLVPYTDKYTAHHYISGTYWIGKKQFMIDNPLDENRTLHQAEDLEWSFRVRPKWNYKMNPHSSVYLLRQKHMDWNG